VRQIKRWHLYLTLISCGLGMLLVWTFLAQAAYRAQTGSSKNSNLIKVINQLEKETSGMEDQIGILRRQLDQAQKNQLGSSQLNEIQNQLQWLKTHAGIVEVTGPGISIELDDNKVGAAAAQATKTGTYQPENFIIHDKNLLYLVYELKTAGAEAIAVNNQRIINSSSIRCVGSVIMVNSTHLAPPYEITAIGNPDNLTKALLNGEEFTYLKSKNFPVKLTTQTFLSIPPYKGTYNNSFAQLKERSN
jgi:uncharacterized protein YlxW (UPF0749 family)